MEKKKEEEEEVQEVGRREKKVLYVELLSKDDRMRTE